MSRVAAEAIVLAHRHGLGSHGRAPTANTQQPSAFSALLDDVSAKPQAQESPQTSAASNVKNTDSDVPSVKVKPRSSRADCRQTDDDKAPPDGPQTQPGPDTAATAQPTPANDCEDPTTKPNVPELVSTADNPSQPVPDPNANNPDATVAANAPADVAAPAIDPHAQLAGAANVGISENATVAAAGSAGKPKDAEEVALHPLAQVGAAVAGPQRPTGKGAAEKPAPHATADSADPAPSGTETADGSGRAAGDAKPTEGNELRSIHSQSADTFDALVRKAGETAGKPRGDDETGAQRDAAKPAVDAAQLASPTPPPDRSGHLTPAAPAAHAAAAATAETSTAVPIAGLAIEIAARAQAGRNRFEIRLDPPELGRIDVRLDVDHKGQVTSHLVVEKAETLDLLKRDAPELERALQQAGLKTSDSGLQFTLRDQAFAGHDGNGAASETARVIVPDAELAPVDAVQSSYAPWSRLDGGIDIRV